MNFRLAHSCDLPRLLELVNQAKASLRQQGIDQWQKGDPNKQGLSSSIAQARLWVMEDQEEVMAMITIVPGPEDSYASICGAWLNDAPYFAFHRVCVEETKKGQNIAGALFSHAEEYVKFMGCSNVRIDTHPQNLPMQKALAKNGYTKCGSLTLAEGAERGSKRLGYQKQL